MRGAQLIAATKNGGLNGIIRKWFNVSLSGKMGMTCQ
jgi:hypothetical protein